MSLQLEVGKTYKNREGTLVTITHKTAFSCTYPYYGDDSTYYMPDGRFREYDLHHDLDLVELVTEKVGRPLELEVGKTYKTRAGKIVTITSYTEFGGYPYIGDSNDNYTADGKIYAFGFHDNDLVEEVSTTPMFGTTWTFPNFKQVVGVPTLTEETKMQDQIITINCTLVVRDIEGTLTLQVHPKDEFWRADDATTVLDSNFELVLPKAKVQELYLAALNFNLDKAEAAYNDTLEARDNGAAFIRSL